MFNVYADYKDNFWPFSGNIRTFSSIDLLVQIPCTTFVQSTGTTSGLFPVTSGLFHTLICWARYYVQRLCRVHGQLLDLRAHTDTQTHTQYSRHICIYIYIYIVNSSPGLGSAGVLNHFCFGLEPSNGRARRCLRARGPQDHLYSRPLGRDVFIIQYTTIHLYVYIYIYICIYKE